MTIDLETRPATAPSPSAPFLALGSIEQHLRSAQKRHLGNPFKCVGDLPVPPGLSQAGPVAATGPSQDATTTEEEHHGLRLD